MLFRGLPHSNNGNPKHLIATLRNHIFQIDAVLDPNKYKNEVNIFKNKINKFKIERNKEIEDIQKRNVKAKNELVSIVTEILAKYSAENQIKLVLNKESIILGIKTIDITNEILTLLDKKVKKIKF